MPGAALPPIIPPSTAQHSTGGRRSDGIRNPIRARLEAGGTPGAPRARCGPTSHRSAVAQDPISPGNLRAVQGRRRLYCARSILTIPKRDHFLSKHPVSASRRPGRRRRGSPDARTPDPPPRGVELPLLPLPPTRQGARRRRGRRHPASSRVLAGRPERAGLPDPPLPGQPRFDPGSESLSIHLERVAGLLSAQLNEREIARPERGTDRLRVPINDPLPPRNRLTLVLEVSTDGSSPVALGDARRSPRGEGGPVRWPKPRLGAAVAWRDGKPNIKWADADPRCVVAIRGLTSWHRAHGMMDQERETQRQTYQLCRLGFGILAASLLLACFTSIVSLMPLFGCGHLKVWFMRQPWWDWLDTPLVWGCLIGTYLLFGRWTETGWQRRVILLIAMEMVDIVLWASSMVRSWGPGWGRSGRRRHGSVTNGCVSAWARPGLGRVRPARQSRRRHDGPSRGRARA